MAGTTTRDLSPIFGIDLGTTNSLIGVMDAGFPILLANSEGKRLTPSVVFFPKNEGLPVVGDVARRNRSVYPERTISSIKRSMGLREITASFGKNDDHDDRKISPEEISSLILKKLVRDAEQTLDQKVERAVITVPAYFNDAQRAATKRAGELAGLTVERILNEPTAAALAYGMDKLKEHSKIAVYDFGGGTFDLSILELNNGVFQVLSTNGNTQLGGDDIDLALTRYLSDKLGIERDTTEFLLLLEFAEEAKIKLSNEVSATIYLPFSKLKSSTSSITLTRDELEKIATLIINQTKDHCIRALADAKLDSNQLDAVILVGGTTYMPIVRRFVGKIFNKEPDTTSHPEEAIALGATIQAGILSGAVRDVVLLDVTPLSLGIETFGGLTNVLIPRNTTIPIKMGEMFTNAVSGQTSMSIKILQGERELAKDNWKLGELEIAFEPAPRGNARVGVQFAIDANGILQVLVRDTKTGKEIVQEIKSGAVDVNDEAVEKMISESVEHAFEDYQDRVLTETRLKSQELLPSVKQALELAGADISKDVKAEIERLVSEVQNALEEPINLERLKKANEALDEGTQELANIIIQQAFDDSLKDKGLL